MTFYWMVQKSETKNRRINLDQRKRGNRRIRKIIDVSKFRVRTKQTPANTINCAVMPVCVSV